MPALLLSPSPLDERTSALLQAGLTLLDLIFPERIKACYLTGSVLDGTAVTIAGDALNSSDIDIKIVLQGALTGLDRERFALWRTMCEQLGPFHLDQFDATVTSDMELSEQGHLTLKTASHLLYGEDIRATIALPPIETHLREAIKLSMIHFATFRRLEPEALSIPLQYPDLSGPYYGYDYHEPGYGDQPGTRLLVGSITWAATALVALKARQLAGTKRAAVSLYEQTINDAWYPLIRAIYQQCKLQWRYQIPDDRGGQAQLRALCYQVLAFEEYCIKTYAFAEHRGGILCA
jgi:hypothetical protein